jgi:hypothetical protein
MSKYKWLLMIFIFAMPLVTNAQDVNARSPQQDKSSTKLQKKAEKKKEARRIRAENSEKRNLKRSMKIQSKETRKRMKKSQKKANAWNANHNRGGFLRKWFGKKNN